jgi:hypothetical protein
MARFRGDKKEVVTGRRGALLILRDAMLRIAPQDEEEKKNLLILRRPQSGRLEG